MRNIVVSIFVLGLLLCPRPAPARARLLELTFDDGPDGSGPADGLEALNNLEARRSSFGVGALTATLTGSAHRSAIGEGRYGRAADFDGDGTIEVTGLTSSASVMSLYLWLNARDASAGTLLELEGAFAIGLDTGMFVVTVGGVSTSLGVSVTPGEWHAISVSVDLSGATPTFTATVDFEPSTPVPVAFGTAAGETMTLGRGLDGLVDEVLLTEGAPSEQERWDFDPDYCPAGYECLEEVLTLVPPGFPHEVPVRFKALWDPARCSDTSPCPVIFDISGGSDCADDYGFGAVRPLANEGFVVVAVDPYCESAFRFQTYPTETSQLVVVKDHILSSSPVAPLIAGTDYAATGCSHGAGTVISWMLHEDDHPARTYPRSSSTDVLCGFMSGVLCPRVEDYLEEFAIETFGDVDPENPALRTFHENSVNADLLTAEIVGTRELALSWGVNLEGPICTPDGNFACNEESLWGMNYGARRFRDVWGQLEASTPTGYFVVDRSSDCSHCAPSDSPAFACGVCLLRHGRAGMETECPECLTYGSPDIDRGRPAELCAMEASWYTDPLAGTIPGTDGGTTTFDAGVGGPVAAGCSCNTSLDQGNSPPWWILMVLAFVFVASRRARSTRRTVPALLYTFVALAGTSCSLPPATSTPMGAPAADCELSPTLAELAEGSGVIITSQMRPEDLLADPEYEALIASQFAQITPGNNFKMRHLRPAAGEFDFSVTDELVAYAEANGQQITGHTLIYGKESSIPRWLRDSDPTREELIAFVEEHVTTVVSRYRGRVAAWDVVNEAFCDPVSNPDCIVEPGQSAGMDNSLWRRVIGPEFIEIALRAARAADPDAQIYVNENGVELSGTPKADFFFDYISDLRTRGVPLDGVGSQMHIATEDVAGMDLGLADRLVRDNIARFNAVGLHFRVTELDVRIRREALSDEELTLQAEIYRMALAACLDAADCPSFTFWSTTDRYSWIPRAKPGYDYAGLFNHDLEPKAAYCALRTELLGR